MNNARKQFAVLGLGSFGASLAESLCSLGHEVLAVDIKGDLVQEIAPLVTQAVQADATDEEVLRSLGIGSFDVVIVCIGVNIRDSILVAVQCKELGVPYVAAKAVDDIHAKVLSKVGVDRVIFPEREMGVRVAKSLTAPSILELVALSDDYEIAEVVVPAAWCGHTLAELNVRRSQGLSVIAIRREKTFVAAPGAQERLQKGDILIILGKKDDVDKIQ